VQAFEERAYWRDVGTLAALAAAQQDAMGSRPRFNLWNRRWPIRGEHDAELFAKLRDWRKQARESESLPLEAAGKPLKPVPAWQAAGRDPRSDERLLPS
jgi:hypothetical protein